MKRALMILASLLSSLWFLPVYVISGTKVSMELLCFQQRCARAYEVGENPIEGFKVLVYQPANGGQVTAVLFDQVHTFLQAHAGSSLLLPSQKGRSNDGAEYTVVSTALNLQHVVLGYMDAARMSFEYNTDGKVVRPIKSKVMSVGYMFLCLPIGILFAWLLRRLSIRWRESLSVAPI
jgi:hypothetical protein